MIKIANKTIKFLKINWEKSFSPRYKVSFSSQGVSVIQGYVFPLTKKKIVRY